MQVNDTAELLGLPVTVVKALGNGMSHVDYLEHVTALLEHKQRQNSHDYNGELFKRRAKAIERYSKWAKDFK